MKNKGACVAYQKWRADFDRKEESRELGALQKGKYVVCMDIKNKEGANGEEMRGGLHVGRGSEARGMRRRQGLRAHLLRGTHTTSARHAAEAVYLGQMVRLRMTVEARAKEGISP
jgi:hypothetical protein